MSAAHTPGPWFVHPEPYKYHWQIYTEQFKKIGSSPCGGSKNTPEQIAALLDNARLMAAAPEMLEALKWFVENDDTNIGQEGNEYWEDGLNRGIAAIAKATGATT